MSAATISAPLALLHVDDNPNDRFLLQLAARRAKTPFTIYDADGAQSAAPYFASWSVHSGANPHPTPSLVLLDYVMGDHNAVDFLHWLRLVRKANTIVVMFTGSTDETVVRNCYSAGANHFLAKPTSLDRILDIIAALQQYMSSDPPRFEALAALPEYRPNPMPTQAAAISDRDNSCHRGLPQLVRPLTRS